MISCKNVFFEYDNDKGNPVLKNVNLSLKNGNIGILLGLKGSGKTTLLECIGQNFCSYTGVITTENNCRFIKELPEFCDDLTGLEYVDMLLSIGGNKTNEIVYQLINSIGIKKNLEKLIKNSSLYTKNIILLLSTLCLDSDTILLDEPFYGLDRKSQLVLIELIKMLKEEKKTILISTNLIYFGFELADDLFILHRGKIKQIKNIFKSSTQYDRIVLPLLL